LEYLSENSAIFRARGAAPRFPVRQPHRWLIFLNHRIPLSDSVHVFEDIAVQHNYDILVKSTIQRPARN